jgi:hypothetical protein
VDVQLAAAHSHPLGGWSSEAGHELMVDSTALNSVHTAVQGSSLHTGSSPTPLTLQAVSCHNVRLTVLSLAAAAAAAAAAAEPVAQDATPATAPTSGAKATRASALKRGSTTGQGAGAKTQQRALADAASAGSANPGAMCAEPALAQMGWPGVSLEALVREHACRGEEAADASGRVQSAGGGCGVFMPDHATRTS